ncbi:MAG: hypothetical protein L3K23_03995 [Thermoplasmata archaeon]|nr:hypothetical protein [Thermoplasmata archaeon]
MIGTYLADLSIAVVGGLVSTGVNLLYQKWRTIPMDTVVVCPMLLEAVQGKRPEDPVYPLSLVTLEKDAVAAGVRIGLKVPGHDLRRSFGRAAY